MKQTQVAALLILVDSGSKAAVSSQLVPCVSPANIKGSSNLLPIFDKALPALAKKKKRIRFFTPQCRYLFFFKFLLAAHHETIFYIGG